MVGVSVLQSINYACFIEGEPQCGGRITQYQLRLLYISKVYENSPV